MGLQGHAIYWLWQTWAALLLIVIVINVSSMASSSSSSISAAAAEMVVLRVGGDDGWVVGVMNYSAWASNHPLHVGDYLEFNYIQDFHNVLEVTEASYTSCNISNPIKEYKDGKTIVRLTKAKTYHFICGMMGHCSLDQKLKVSALTNTPSQSKAPTPLPTTILPPSLSPAAPIPLSSSSNSYMLPNSPNIALSFPLLCWYITRIAWKIMFSPTH